MTFTYDSTDISTDLAKARLALGDTDSASPLLTDEEINHYLSLATNVYMGAALAARAIAGKFARMADTQIETVSVRNSQKSMQYNALAEQLEKMAGVNGANIGPSATGISIDAMDAADDLTDRPQPAFKQGQFNDPPNRDDRDDVKWR